MVFPHILCGFFSLLCRTLGVAVDLVASANNETILRYVYYVRSCESCLLVGFADKIPIHIVCGWRGEEVAIITVYVPGLPEFIDPWTRGETPQ